MISRYDAISRLFSGPPQPEKYFPQKSAAEIRMEEQKAQEEAQRKNQQEAQNRMGAAQTLLTSPDLGGTFGGADTRRPSLLGA